MPCSSHRSTTIASQWLWLCCNSPVTCATGNKRVSDTACLHGLKGVQEACLHTAVYLYCWHLYRNLPAEWCLMQLQEPRHGCHHTQTCAGDILYRQCQKHQLCFNADSAFDTNMTSAACWSTECLYVADPETRYWPLWLCCCFCFLSFGVVILLPPAYVLAPFTSAVSIASI